MIDWFFDRYFGTAWPFTDPRAIPSLYEDYSGLPPALIVTAGHDPLRDEGQEYAMRLADAGVPVEYDCREGTIHGFMNMGRVLRSRARLGAEAHRFLAVPASTRDNQGGRLKQPSGWRYTSIVPETDLVLGAQGKATVVQDELENTYQKLD